MTYLPPNTVRALQRALALIRAALRDPAVGSTRGDDEGTHSNLVNAAALLGLTLGEDLLAKKNAAEVSKHLKS